jgi:predicted transcriptional regulator
MKTAVSIPDEVFEDAERLARRLKRSRSDVYSQALAEYVARHAPDEITERMNAVVAGIEASPQDDFASRAGRRALKRVEW